MPNLLSTQSEKPTFQVLEVSSEFLDSSNEKHKIWWYSNVNPAYIHLFLQVIKIQRVYHWNKRLVQLVRPFVISKTDHRNSHNHDSIQPQSFFKRPFLTEKVSSLFLKCSKVSRILRFLFQWLSWYLEILYRLRKVGRVYDFWVNFRPTTLFPTKIFINYSFTDQNFHQFFMNMFSHLIERRHS